MKRDATRCVRRRENPLPERTHTAFGGVLSRTLVAFAGLMAVALQPAAADTFAPDARQFTLKNGMEIVVIPDHRTPVVTHMVWYKVGSADEPAGKTGVAHFLEHLMFKGTTAHPDGAFSRLVAENGGQENAFTSTDYTAYFQRVAKEHLPLVMELEADRMANLVLSEEEVTSERDVVMEERRSRVDNEPASQLAEELSASLYRAHPYGRPVIGWEHEIRQLNRADAIDVYNTYYTPNNAVLVVAGDVMLDEVLQLAERTYGQLARRAEPRARVRTSEPPQRAERDIVLTSDRVDQPTLRRIYDVPSYRTAQPGEAEALDVLSELLGGGATSRLYRSLVVDRKIATSVGSWYSGTALDNGQFGAYGVPRGEATLKEVEAAIDAAIADIAENGVSAEELERTKTGLVAEAVYAQDSQSSLARVFGSALTTGMTLEDVQSWPDRISKVSADDVRQAAQTYLRVERSVTGYLVKHRAAIGAPEGGKS